MEENRMEEMRKKMEARSEVMDMILDMMAETTQDPRMIMVAKHNKQVRKIRDLSANEDITDEQFEKITQLIEQFDKLIDDVLKEE